MLVHVATVITIVTITTTTEISMYSTEHMEHSITLKDPTYSLPFSNTALQEGQGFGVRFGFKASLATFRVVVLAYLLSREVRTRAKEVRNGSRVSKQKSIPVPVNARRTR